MNKIDDIVVALKEDYDKKYIHQLAMSADTVDPLADIVPCFVDKREFFGTYVCNIVVFDKVYFNDDFEWDTQVEATKLLLQELFLEFARYEAHFYIDLEASEIDSASEEDIENMETRLNDLAEALEDYNVTYHGKLDASELDANIRTVLENFYSNTGSE